MTKTLLNLFNSNNYYPGPKLLIVFWYLCNALFFKTWVPFPSRIKMLLLRTFGAKLGKNILIKPCVNIKYPWKLQIGNNVWIGENVWIDNLAHVVIGDNVCLSQGAMLLTGNHNYKKVSFDLIIGAIILEEGVWIGAKSIVCPGVTCETHSVLSVNSVANHNLSSYSIYHGNPAILIREREIS